MQPKYIIALYLSAIVAANLLVAAFGPAISILNAFVFIALDLTARDRLHEAWRGEGLAWKMAALIGAGSALSYLLNVNTGPIALASFVAFGVAATLDALCYHLLRGRDYLVKVNGSNVVSAAADSLFFPLLAFGLPLLWPVVVGQFIAKVFGGFLWAWMFRAKSVVLAVD
jgi:queuosine precursor transporter